MKRLTRTRVITLSAISVAIAIVLSVAYFVISDTEHPLSHTPSRLDFPVRGIDVSSHNGIIDFEKVKGDSIDFVYVKATEGATFKDRRFRRNILDAKHAGLRVGAYHFFRFDTPGYMQGLNFLNSVRGYPLDLPLMIDIEEWANPREYTTDAISAQLSQMIQHLNSHGHRVILYSNKDGYERFLKERFSHLPLWICTFSPPADDIDWTLWQYSHRGEVAGIHDKVDMNTFNGSVPEWEAWGGATQLN